jgi:hypothetical protein
MVRTIDTPLLRILVMDSWFPIPEFFDSPIPWIIVLQKSLLGNHSHCISKPRLPVSEPCHIVVYYYVPHTTEPCTHLGNPFYYYLILVSLVISI